MFCIKCLTFVFNTSVTPDWRLQCELKSCFSENDHSRSTLASDFLLNFLFFREPSHQASSGSRPLRFHGVLSTTLLRLWRLRCVPSTSARRLPAIPRRPHCVLGVSTTTPLRLLRSQGDCAETEMRLYSVLAATRKVYVFPDDFICDLPSKGKHLKLSAISIKYAKSKKPSTWSDSCYGNGGHACVITGEGFLVKNTV